MIVEESSEDVGRRVDSFIPLAMHSHAQTTFERPLCHLQSSHTDILSDPFIDGDGELEYRPLTPIIETKPDSFTRPRPISSDGE